jgi:hypothetical protein
MQTRINKVNLFIGIALVILGCIGFVGPFVLPLGCGPGSLLVQSACDNLRSGEFFSSWYLGASSFALAFIIFSVGETRKPSRRQILELACLSYGGVPFALFLMMIVTGLPGGAFVPQVVVAYYLLAVIAGLVTIFGRAGDLQKQSKVVPA